MKFISSASFVLLSSMAVVANAEPAAKVKLTRLEDRVRVEVDGKLFTEYIFKGASRPYCYPVLAADGTPLSRDFPMAETPGEDRDHPHHRALMFVHGDANKIDFWNEGTAGGNLPKGNTVHDGLIETKSGDVGVLRARNRWVSPDGKLIATDETTIRFHGTATTRKIDYEVTIHALPDTPLVMGDSKEGVMSIRVAQWMTLPHKYEGKDLPGIGHLLNSAGDRDAAAWGKRAEWADYYAPHEGKTYGIALFDHPQNLRHPTWWHARDYGLFAANPFGQSQFELEKKLPPETGNYTIAKGGALTLRYRFYIHSGDPVAAGVAQHFADYAAGR